MSKGFADAVDFESINIIGRECYKNSAEHGFWENTPRNKGEMLALIHSEVSEVLEAVRKPDLQGHIPPITLEAEELADVCIRVFDYAAGHGIDLGQAIQKKMAFNALRPHKHGKLF